MGDAARGRPRGEAKFPSLFYFEQVVKTSSRGVSAVGPSHSCGRRELRTLSKVRIGPLRGRDARGGTFFSLPRRAPRRTRRNRPNATRQFRASHPSARGGKGGVGTCAYAERAKSILESQNVSRRLKSILTTPKYLLVGSIRTAREAGAPSRARPARFCCRPEAGDTTPF